jgi:toxin ParE1/3/4
MTYRVELARRAVRDLAGIYEEKQVEEIEAATKWFTGLTSGFNTLADMPQRCPKLPEAGDTRRDLRQLLYGRKPNVYRILFEIDETTGKVRIFGIRHGAQKPLNRSSFF